MKRLIYLDWLRIFAIIAVVTIHTSAGTVTANLYENPQSYWLSGNLYEALSRVSVPLFVMISGALMLRSEKKIAYREFFQKRLSKILIPLIGWSIIYYIYKVYMGIFPLSGIEFGKLFLNSGISVHFWFLYMILGIYLITPLVKLLINHATRRDIEYFLVLWVIASVIFKFVLYFFDIKIRIELNFVTNYVGYFVLGYYLSHFDIRKSWRVLSYFGTIVGLFLTFFLTYVFTVRNDGGLEEFWYEYLSPNVWLVSIGIFLFFRYALPSGMNRVPRALAIISRTSFGIYLVHMLVMSVFTSRIFNFIFDGLHPILSIPVYVAITITISIVMVVILERIPLVKKLVP